MSRAAALRRVHRDESGQSLVVVLSLVMFLFLIGSALAMQASVALRTTAAGRDQAGALYAADGGAELGIWWQRQGNAGNPPSTTLNGTSVATSVASAGGAAPTGAGWLHSGFNGRSWSLSSEPGPAGSGARWSPHPTVPQGARVATPVVGNDGYVYVGGTDGLYAFTPSGLPAWSFASASQVPVTGGFIGSPAILTTGSGARMIVAATEGTATTASRVFGLTENATRTAVTVTWSFSLGNGSGVGFVGGLKLNAAGTRVFLGAQNGTLYAFSTAAAGNNPPLWTAAVGGAVTTAPSLNTAETRVYAATSTGLLRAYNATTGAQFWTRTVSAGSVLTAPIFASTTARDQVYVASGANSTLYAVRDNGNGAQASWNLPLGAAASSTPAVRVVGTQVFVFVATDAGTIRKVEDLSTSGPVLWTHTPAASAIRSGLAVDSAGAVYYGDEAGAVRRIADAGVTASTTWTATPAAGAVRSAVAIGVADDLYAATAGSRLIAIGPVAARPTVTVVASAGGTVVTTTYPSSGPAAPTLGGWSVTR